MDHERWQTIRTILERAFEASPADRRAVLDEACDGDSVLRAEVEKLLLAEAQAATLDGRLAELPGMVAAAVDAMPAEDPLVGAIVDRYRLIRRIGRGGSATVYLAERADDHYKQRVALKVIEASDTDELLLRFRNERQILAGLVHPNIARLLDGGRIEGQGVPDRLRGRPYMVMEYVDGLPLDEHCNAHRLDIPSRLRLFRTVCEAVANANQNLVVHRDLKPGNILVDREGQVKLLDFGIAKVLNPELSSAAMSITQSDLRMLSPSYASPEQILGDTITTASDVYSLGVVLYELLAGTRPYGTEAGLQTLIGQILEADRLEPSRAPGERAEEASAQRQTTPRQLVRQLEGDLDAICAKALARQPTDRYATAAALGDDIGRHLDGRPVLARRHAPLDHVRRWAKRNAVALGAAATCLLLLIGALITAIYQARAASLARDAAEQKAAVATEITEFVAGIFDTGSPEASENASITARTLLDQGVERARTEAGRSREVKAALLHVIGRSYWRLGMFDDAASAFEEALELRRTLYPDGHRDLALTQRQVARVMAVRGQLTVANRLHRESIAMLEREASDDRLEVARGLTYLSYSLGLSGEMAEAEDLRRRSLALKREALRDDHPDVAQGWNDLGHVLMSRGKLVEGERALQRALTIRRAYLDENHPDIALSLSNIAKVKLAAGRVDDASAAAEESVAISRQIFGSRHYRLAISLETLAKVRLAAGRLGEAEAAAHESLAIFEVAYPRGHTRVGLGWGYLAEIKLQGGDIDAAGSALIEAVKIMSRVTPAGHLAWVDLWIFEGRWLLAQARYEEAEGKLQAALDVLEAHDWPAGVALRMAAQTMIALYEATGREEDTVTYRPLAEVPRL